MIKKITMMALFALLPLQLFAYEISFNKKFSKVVTPDILKTFISINVENDDENYINRNIDRFNNFIKDNDTIIKKNGSFILNPKYRYYKNKQEFMGYVGTLRYEIQSSDAKKINKFIDDLIALKKRVDAREVKVNISNLSWKISENLYEKSVDLLRIEVITWANKYSKNLSTKLLKNCEVKNININNVVRNNFFRSEAMSMNAKTVSDLAPVNSDKTISLNPNFLMECK
ncbi:SIMPL domain-containing protein [Malaciobacter sp. WC5094]|uniref:SIMPL domain-containing protein n=1 Tax=Arcobacter sp. YIC-80 TaxID=3376683 RepID=UPI00384C7DC1